MERQGFSLCEPYTGKNTLCYENDYFFPKKRNIYLQPEQIKAYLEFPTMKRLENFQDNKKNL